MVLSKCSRLEFDDNNKENFPRNRVQSQSQFFNTKVNSGKKPKMNLLSLGRPEFENSEFKDSLHRQINSFGSEINKQSSSEKQRFVYGDSYQHQTTCNTMDEEALSTRTSEDSGSLKFITQFSPKRSGISEQLVSPGPALPTHDCYYVEQKLLLPVVENYQSDNRMVHTIHRGVLYHILEADMKEGSALYSKHGHSQGTMDVEGCDADLLDQLQALSPPPGSDWSTPKSEKGLSGSDVHLGRVTSASLSTCHSSSDFALQRNLSLNLDSSDMINKESQEWIANHPAPTQYFKHTNHVLVIFDCRFYYEYKEGHIRGAINLSKPSLIDFLFFQFSNHMFHRQFLIELNALTGSMVTLEKLMELVSRFPDPKRNCSPIVIFHCEFSYCRAPNIWKFLRDKDRKLSMSQHPDLIYPQIYLLKQGYSTFFNERSDLCSARSRYIKMNDASYAHLYDAEFKHLHQDWDAVEGSSGRGHKHKKKRC